MEPAAGMDVVALRRKYGPESYVGIELEINQRFIQASEAGTAVLLISEDLDEILQLSHRIAVLYEGRIVGTLPRSHAERASIGLMMAGGRSTTAEVA